MIHEIKWVEITRERYEEMLCVLPPETRSGYGFLVGEPYDHQGREGAARFTAFVARRLPTQDRLRYFEATRPLTVDEFNTLYMPHIQIVIPRQVVKQFTLEMNCDNDAFQDAPEREIVRVLTDLSQRMLHGGITFAAPAMGMTEFGLTDTNGNKVGSALYVVAVREDHVVLYTPSITRPPETRYRGTLQKCREYIGARFQDEHFRAQRWRIAVVV